MESLSADGTNQLTVFQTHGLTHSVDKVPATKKTFQREIFPPKTF